MRATEAVNPNIAEFQERRREFQRHWNRNWLFVFLPGFLLFAAGGPGGLLLPGGEAHHNLWLIVPGVCLGVIGMARGA